MGKKIRKRRQHSLHKLHHSNFTHQATEACECSRDASLWIDLYQGIFLCMDVNLQQACPVQWTVHQHEQTLQ